jgi:hypothetical protein
MITTITSTIQAGKSVYLSTIGSTLAEAFKLIQTAVSNLPSVFEFSVGASGLCCLCYLVLPQYAVLLLIIVRFQYLGIIVYKQEVVDYN